MTARDLDAVRVGTLTADVIRLTPLDDCVPDHQRAVTYVPREPLNLATVALYRHPTFDPRGGGRRSIASGRPALHGMSAALQTKGSTFHDEPTLDAITRELRRNVRTGVSFEVWTRETTPDDTPLWLYSLMPVFIPDPLDEWPVPEQPDVTVHVAGDVLANALHTWPDPAPYEAPDPLDLTTYARGAVTRQQPPPEGPVTHVTPRVGPRSRPPRAASAR
ncbi:hypothetical protein B0E38_04751 [Streptomyces sp. 111WW2]|uniref:hypothetical protein n=1 Tax=Streptomyces sp. 111WW2 TaxID=1945515 RepID=UPI000D0C8384|nr:hypothetical protein [Streptomyces sp. 111WW2]PSK52425.1 hypothetical protein B0E38_04751 [Streptomyces sp. 111WW2]